MKRKWFIPLALLWCSCETVVEVDIPTEPTKIVVNSLFEQDSALTVDLSQSKVITDPDEIVNITDATVNLYQGSTLLESLTHLANGQYQSTLSLSPSTTYSLEVTSPSLPTVRAQTTMPEKVPITALSQRVVQEPVFLTSEDALSVSFSDPPGQQNYYAIVIRNLDSFDDEYMTIYEHDPSDDDALFMARGQVLYKENETRDGGTITIELLSTGLIFSENMNVQVELRHVSAAYYFYAQSVRDNEYNSGDPFLEPVQVYSNVEDGLGIFAAFNTSIEQYTFN